MEEARIVTGVASAAEGIKNRPHHRGVDSLRLRRAVVIETQPNTL